MLVGSGLLALSAGGLRLMLLLGMGNRIGDGQPRSRRISGRLSRACCQHSGIRTMSPRTSGLPYIDSSTENSNSGPSREDL